MTLATCTSGLDKECSTESVDKTSPIRRGHIDEDVPTHVEIDGELYNMTILTVCRCGDDPESDSASCNNTMIEEYLSGAHYLYVKSYYTKKENTGSTEATGSVASFVCSKDETVESVDVSANGIDPCVIEISVLYVERVEGPSLKHDKTIKDNATDTSYEETGSAPNEAS